MEDGKKRFVGIDMGKRTFEVAVIGADGKVTRSNGVTGAEGRQKLYRKLERGDRVAIEAGNLAFEMAKEMISWVGCEVVVLNASKLAIIYASMKKTDKEDALKLAKLVQKFDKSELPVVAVPSDREMKRRKLLSAYRQAKCDRTRAVNRLHALFLRQGLTDVVKKDLATKEQREKTAARLTDFEAEESVYVAAKIDLAEKRIGELQVAMDT
jgi:transposase